MPIDETHPILNTQEKGLRIWKYMDVPSFLSLLTKKSLTFVRCDLINEKYEGTFPKITSTEIDQYASKAISTGKLNPGYQNLSEILESDRNKHYINCWCKSEFEMFHMWKVYSKENGIAIETKYEKLKTSIISSEKIFPTDVEYIDFNNPPYINWTNGMSIIKIKKSEYIAENELRLLIAYPRELEDQLLLYKSHEDKRVPSIKLYSETPVILCEIDVRELISKIHISPFAPKWFTTVVIDTLCQFGLSDIEVVQSEL